MCEKLFDPQMSTSGVKIYWVRRSPTYVNLAMTGFVAEPDGKQNKGLSRCCSRCTGESLLRMCL